MSYGFNNRTQMLRIPAAGRIEDRTVDGSCNPYLAATAVLAAGLDGIENGLDAGDPTTELNLHDLTEDQRKELGVELLPANLLSTSPTPPSLIGRTVGAQPPGRWRSRRDPGLGAAILECDGSTSRSRMGRLRRRC